MHSLVIAEPVGIVIGVIAGREGSRIGKKIAQQYDIPPFLGAMLGSFIAHYAVSAIVKGLINAGLLDVPGAATNIAVTSPLAAGAHGLIEGVLEFLPDLHDLIGNEITNALPDMINDVTTNIDSDNLHHSTLGFGHSVQPIEIIADLQYGPTCGLEAIENMIQAANPNISNNISDYLQHHLALKGINLRTEGLPMELYQDILGMYDIQSHWTSFNHDTILNNLNRFGGTVAITGDGYYVDSANLTPKSWHAITLTDPWRVEGQGLIGYVGIDSNHPNQAYGYTFQQIENMVKNGNKNWKHFGQVLIARK